jgi:hypothetical protein
VPEGLALRVTRAEPDELGLRLALRVGAREAEGSADAEPVTLRFAVSEEEGEAVPERLVCAERDAETLAVAERDERLETVGSRDAAEEGEGRVDVVAAFDGFEEVDARSLFVGKRDTRDEGVTAVLALPVLEGSGFAFASARRRLSPPAAGAAAADAGALARSARIAATQSVRARSAAPRGMAAGGRGKRAAGEDGRGSAGAHARPRSDAQTRALRTQVRERRKDALLSRSALGQRGRASATSKEVSARVFFQFPR